LLYCHDSAILASKTDSGLVAKSGISAGLFDEEIGTASRVCVCERNHCANVPADSLQMQDDGVAATQPMIVQTRQPGRAASPLILR
jgi:hypothetical protein